MSENKEGKSSNSIRVKRCTDKAAKNGFVRVCSLVHLDDAAKFRDIGRELRESKKEELGLPIGSNHRADILHSNQIWEGHENKPYWVKNDENTEDNTC